MEVKNTKDSKELGEATAMGGDFVNTSPLILNNQRPFSGNSANFPHTTRYGFPHTYENL